MAKKRPRRHRPGSGHDIADTSLAAFRRVDISQQERVFAYISSRSPEPGATREEVVAAVGILTQSAAGRIRELWERRQIDIIGKRQASTNCASNVYAAAPRENWSDVPVRTTRDKHLLIITYGDGEIPLVLGPYPSTGERLEAARAEFRAGTRVENTFSLTVQSSGEVCIRSFRRRTGS